MSIVLIVIGLALLIFAGGITLRFGGGMVGVRKFFWSGVAFVVAGIAWRYFA